MPACPECASEVADNDIYCPYCGISLRPADVTPQPEDPLAHTIVTSVSELPIPPLVETPPVLNVAPVEASVARHDTSLEPVENAAVEPDVPIVGAAEPERQAEPSIPNITESEENVEAPDLSLLDVESIAPASDLEATLNDYQPVESEISEPPTTDAADLSPDADMGSEAAEAIAEVPTAAEVVPVQAHEESPDAFVPPMPDLLAAEPVAVDEDLAASTQPAENSAVEPPPSDAQEGSSPQMTTPKAADGGTSSIAASDQSTRARLQILTGGTVLNNRYEILKKIGGGGMGAVYLSNDRNLGGVQRAVKEMVQAHIEDAQQSKAIDDFRRESMILSSLDHPSIPTIYDYFFDTSEGRFYLVMKYISGGDLAGRLRETPEGRIDELTVAEWGFQIADVLSYLHNLPQRIVYRDLKPSNVMLDGSTGKIMLIDFGIARSVNQIEERGVTAVGTMGYAPPELFSGNVEPRSDIYSLGSTMFHLMTGADPQNNPLLIFDFEKNPRPRQINPRLSDQIEKILMKCVEYSAEKRFATAADLRDALGAHADNLRAGRVTFGVGAAPIAVGLDEQTVFCGFCGQRIVAADMFCAFCGARQPLAQNSPPPVSTQFAAPKRSGRTARLVIEGTTELEAPVYLIEKPDNLLGRRDPMSNIFPEVDLSKFDPQTKISRRHARIINDGVDFLVEDLGSSNGTTVLSTESGNLRLRPNQPHRLANGDRIKLGDTTLHFWVS